MTNSVSQLASMLKQVPGMAASAEKPKETDLSFGSFLTQTFEGSSKEDHGILDIANGSENDISGNHLAYEKETSQSNYKDVNIAKKDNTGIQDKLPKDAEDQIEQFGSEVKKELEEKLGVTEEELEQAMETLGLQVLDLMEPANLAQLVMKLTGSQDISELLISTDFQSLLGQVEELTQGLMETLGLKPEELNQLKEMIKAGNTESPQEQLIPEEELLKEDQAEEGISEEEQIKQPAVQEKRAEETSVKTVAVKDEQNQNPELEGETAKEDAKVQQAVTQPEEDADGETKDTGGEQKGFQQETGMKQEAGTEKTESHVTYQTTSQTVNNGQAVEVVQTVTKTTVDVENLLRQISQMSRISVSQAQSSIEMQLNPENLGKVYLQVISKEGAITAQIAAQNEAVKEALESQIVTLRENMNQQGMKVEAIEVTIASHEFERNLDQNQNDAAKEQQENSEGRTARRSLNLNSLDELEGLMSEEETLAAKIMSESGNSVDLTA